MTASFAPLPLPGRGDSLAGDIAAWAGSSALAALLDAFELERPAGTRLADRLESLERSARRWDFRRGKERSEAGGETFTPEREELIRAAATALGLLGRQTPAADEYDHVLVLGAGVGPMMERARLAADTLHGGVRAPAVSGLGSRRPLTKQIPALPHCPAEDDAVDLGLRRAFALTQPAAVREGTSAAGLAWRLRSYAGAGPSVHVLAAPAAGPDGRRPTTPDGYLLWAETIPADPAGSRLLVVTTDLFVPFQHCAAVRVLGLSFGCIVDTIGFDRARSPYEPPPRATELLQEIRSTILWLREIASALG